MATKNGTLVTGVFSNRVDATRAIQRLEESGFRDEDISLLMSDPVGKDFKIEDSSKMPEGLAAGATAGGVIGALIAGLQRSERSPQEADCSSPDPWSPFSQVVARVQVSAESSAAWRAPG